MASFTSSDSIDAAVDTNEIIKATKENTNPETNEKNSSNGQIYGLASLVTHKNIFYFFLQCVARGHEFCESSDPHCQRLPLDYPRGYHCHSAQFV